MAKGSSITNTAAPLRELPAVTLRMSCVMEWVKTSSPVAVEDKRRGKWMLKLRYTQSTKKRTRLVWSPTFETQDAALAAAGWWRLSWEQGHNGKEIGPHTGSDEISSTTAADLAAADLPQGEFSCAFTMIIEEFQTARTADFKFQTAVRTQSTVR